MIDNSAKIYTYKDKNWNLYTAKKLINGRYILFKQDWTYVNIMFKKQYDILKYIKTHPSNKKLVVKNNKTTPLYAENVEDAKIIETFVPIIFFSRYNERYKAIKTIDGRYVLIREDWTYVDRFFRKQFEIITYLK